MTKTKAKRHFYDPHPGMAGCSVPIPEAVRLAANALAGRTLTLAYAIKKIDAAGTGGKVEAHSDCIMLTIVSAMVHCWRVIRHEAA